MRILTALFFSLSSLGAPFLSYSAENLSYKVKSITTIKEYGKDMDWSKARDLIASAKTGHSGYFEVFVVKPDGSGEVNLTAGKSGCPQKHNGSVTWHPSGDFIAFTAQNEDTPSNKIADRLGVPGSGLNCNLWVMKSDGSRFWQLTHFSTAQRLGKARGLIHPQFSHDGKKILWAERLGPGKYALDDGYGDEAGDSGVNFKNMSFKEKRQFLLERRKNHSGEGGGVSGIKQDPAFIWGEWALKIADFIPDANNPRIANIRTYQPGEQRAFYETHAWSADDKKILFSGNLLKGQPAVGLDIYEMDLATQQIRNLNNSLEEWDEHAHYSPDGRMIAWMSSHGLELPYESDSGRGWGEYLKTELCIMNSDGTNKQRLTHFNDPGYPEYMDGARCIVSDSAFSPDGSKIVAMVAYAQPGERIKGKMMLIEIAE